MGIVPPSLSIDLLSSYSVTTCEKERQGLAVFFESSSRRPRRRSRLSRDQNNVSDPDVLQQERTGPALHDSKTFEANRYPRSFKELVKREKDSVDEIECHVSCIYAGFRGTKRKCEITRHVFRIYAVDRGLSKNGKSPATLKNYYFFTIY